MAELVDALDSKSGYRKVVQVRFLFGAQLIGCQGVTLIRSSLFFCSFSIVLKTSCTGFCTMLF
jgi:hypothetical protein